MEKSFFGKLNDGTEISLYTLKNAAGTTVQLSDLGATIVSVVVKDKNGVDTDVVLGYDTPQEYVDNTCFFGAVIGRSGNRIDKASFKISGMDYKLVVNDNENNLHSGPNGFDVRRWDAKEAEGNAVTFALDSPDGDEGFPGNMHVEVTYTLSDDSELELHYTAVSDADTVANLTNHVYFNLAGHDSGTILDQELMINTGFYTPVIDGQAIPTGEIASVKNTPMDFSVAKKIGLDIEADFQQLKYVGGFDHNYALSRDPGERKLMAEAYSEKTGIKMEAYTDCAGMQFYAGNAMTTQKGKGGVTYEKRHGFCLESQYYPNSINEGNFATPILKAGDKYDTRTSYKFSVK